MSLAFVLFAAEPALAQDMPVFAPAPDWVVQAPEIDPAKLAQDAPVVVMFDNQQKLEDGAVWAYFNTATRAASAEIMASLGTIQLPWQPSRGQLIVHQAEIIRGAEHIDLLKGGKAFTVLRREPGMDRRILDGALTATLPVEGMQVGDIVHVVFSMTLKDATLKGKIQTAAPLMFQPFRADFGRVRMLWPEKDDIRWKAYADRLSITPVANGRYREIAFKMPLPEQAELPIDVPMRLRRIPVIEASSFKNWAEVAAVMAPLYVTDGLTPADSPLNAEIARITAADTDPFKRTAQALQLVQDRIRYQLMAMDGGNYVPQSPTETWTLRYGDCKAKTLLLLALLHKMGIEAEAVLANTTLGPLVSGRLPAASAFDHVLVRATINGETLWLDGTGSGTRLADLRDTPPLDTVLPLGRKAAVLTPIAMRPDARPMSDVKVDLDMSAGINLPAPFRIHIAMRGPSLEMMRAAMATSSKDDLEKMLTDAIGEHLPSPTVSARSLRFDDVAGTAMIEGEGVAYPGWVRENERQKLTLDETVQQITFTPDRSQEAWRDMPVAAGGTASRHIETRITLPADGSFTTEGVDSLSGTFAGVTVSRKVSVSRNEVTIDSRTVSSPTEIAATAIAEERRKLAAAQALPLNVVAPAGYPDFWQEVEAAKRANKIAPILAVYSKRVTDKPDQSSSYSDRAWFLERIFERDRAVADMTKALAIEPSVESYLKRSKLYFDLNNNAKAMADAKAARAIDPTSAEVVVALARVQAENGDRPGAIALLQDRIDIGGKDQADFIVTKAQIEADGGDKEKAIATLDAAIVKNPGKPNLLNSRCWVKGLHNLGLNTALKDCTKAIELSDSPAGPLDSRAMVYYRLNRLDDALIDLEAALASAPDLAPSLFMRGIIRKKVGETAAGEQDISAARAISPRLENDYKRYGIGAAL